MRRISQQEWENEHMHNPMTEGEALAVEAFQNAMEAKYGYRPQVFATGVLMNSRDADRYEGWKLALTAHTAARQPVQEGGGEVGEVYGPKATSTMVALHRPLPPGTKLYAAPPSAPVGVDMPAIWHRLGWAESAVPDDWRLLVREARESIETLWNTQQPAQAAPGDVASRQAWYLREIERAESYWIETMQDRFDGGDDVPGKDHFVALWLAERTPPGDDAAGGG